MNIKTRTGISGESWVIYYDKKDCKERVCLRCSIPFLSYGPENRSCYYCYIQNLGEVQFKKCRKTRAIKGVDDV